MRSFVTAAIIGVDPRAREFVCHCLVGALDASMGELGGIFSLQYQLPRKPFTVAVLLSIFNSTQETCVLIRNEKVRNILVCADEISCSN